MPDQNDITPGLLLECAAETARAAGNHAKDNLSRRTEVVEKFTHDVKLQLDLECQKKAEELILSRFPDHSFLGEERAEDNTGANQGYQWIVDPIDGTINFSHGLPFWCCSVAVRRGEKVLAGAVFAPMLNEIYTATADGPAELNGSQIRVSETQKLADSLLHTGTDKKFEGNPAPLSLFKAVALSVQRARITGFAAFDICQVAAGRADGYFEGEIYIWDVAAGGLIVERAGGTTEVVNPPDKRWKMSFMATNGHIHKELKNKLQTAVLD
jgi:myo-inositol-1(or 4)-monophosphatase